MNVIEYVTPSDLLFGLLATIVCLSSLIKSGAIRNWVDPLLLPLFQTILTAVLLGGRVIPFIDVMMFVGFLVLFAWGRGGPPAVNSFSLGQWRRTIAPLVVLSIVLNLYLINEKGLLIFQEDLSSARQEFYQGWGLVQRLNSICALVFGVHWAMRFVSGGAWTIKGLALLGWTCYLILSLGSKSGLFTLLTCVGCVASFRGFRLDSRRLSALVLGVAVSVLLMFVLFFDSDALTSFGIRVISYVDGPFYYFSSPTPPAVTLSYPFDQLSVALRVRDALPQSSLGPAINLDALGFDNELFGPNPQIFVEARAVFGPLWWLYYLVSALVIVAILRLAKTPYGLVLFASIAAPLLIDSQFAMSNALNVAIAYLFKIGISAIPRLRTRHAPSQPSNRLSGV